MNTLTEIEELTGGFVPPDLENPEEIYWDSNIENNEFVSRFYLIYPRNVLTLVDGEDDTPYAIGGFHYVNRFGFLLLKNPLPPHIDLDSLCVPYIS